MSLPWCRLDTNIAGNDKVLALLDPSTGPKRWQAFALYVCGMGWSVGHSTDGLVPKVALKQLHGDVRTARLLVIDRGFGSLWTEVPMGWHIVNFAERQQLDVITAGKNHAARVASEKANCVRWHKQPCWQGDHCPIISGSGSDSDRISGPDSDSDLLRTVRTVRTNGEGQDVALSGSFAERATRATRKTQRERTTP